MQFDALLGELVTMKAAVRHEERASPEDIQA